MAEEIKIALYLGMDERGQLRLEALRRMAAEAGYFWGGEPSPGRFIAAQIDEWLDFQAYKADEARQEAAKSQREAN